MKRTPKQAFIFLGLKTLEILTRENWKYCNRDILVNNDNFFSRINSLLSDFICLFTSGLGLLSLNDYFFNLNELQCV